MKKVFKILGALLLVIVAFIVILTAVFFPSIKKVYFGYEIVYNDSSLMIIQGGGGNSVILNTDSAVLVVDTKIGKAAKKLHDDVMALAEDKKVIIINTHSDRDHTGGNPLYQGAKVITGKVDENYWKRASGDDRVPEVWVTDSLTMKLGDETVSVISMGQAHTWNDVAVFFHNSGVLATGDMLFNHMNVALADVKGSNGRNYPKAIYKLQQIQGVRKVVPGHGETGGPELLDMMQSYFNDMSHAADDPAREKEIRKKYKEWLSMPGMTPGAVLENLKKNQATE